MPTSKKTRNKPHSRCQHRALSQSLKRMHWGRQHWNQWLTQSIYNTEVSLNSQNFTFQFIYHSPTIEYNVSVNSLASKATFLHSWAWMVVMLSITYGSNGHLWKHRLREWQNLCELKAGNYFLSKICKSELWKAALWVKYVQWKHEGLSSDLQQPGKGWARRGALWCCALWRWGHRCAGSGSP